MNEATTEIKNRIRALLAKGEATEHEGEAALYMGKAVELMEKYQVELFELHVDDPVGSTIGVRAQAGPPSYKSDVQCALARYYGAEPIIIWATRKHWDVHIAGLESSRITTELMTDFVWAQVGAQATELCKTRYINRGQAVREIAKALCIRIRREIHVRKQATTPAPAGSAFSLAVVDSVDQFIKKEYPDLDYKPAKRITTTHSAMDAANKIKLNHQFGSKDRLRIE